ncbi:DUF3995 domain-containing protein [Paenibacillus sp. NEAU-GSW1]|uniref:DUF3995 domain-containing protein n=1 Tax=Paenibacillus sp. NEAU-GSW1 TaxID=2682486 RepID=UPI0012E21824|nr:DUF3995 domain-containing protein [Paenibacillus sp. NEAU-GSW1]MUT64820.1 DUF3995 domain-containing protein [Paenibacillus sp. NEAU-GSW1]
MTEILAWVVSGLLFAVSGIHFYWVFGGRKGYRAAIPSISNDQEPLFRPTKPATAVVAILMALAAWAVAELGGGIEPVLFSDTLLRFAGWALAIVFVLRAVGDFKWLGLFKSKKGTVFARWDSLLYSPLCLLLGAALFVIILQ